MGRRILTAHTFFNFSYRFELPKIGQESSYAGKFINGWALEGIGVYQSGQPFSVIDYSGAVGSLYYGVSNGITNPIVPLSGCTPKSALTGDVGVNGPALYAHCFSIPILQPGALNGAIPTNDPYETAFTSGQRNIFRQAWQKRLDASIVKMTRLTERSSLQFTFDIFNGTNTPSFDIPINNVTQNQYYNGFPVQGTPPLPTNCGTVNQANGFYNCPFGLGNVNKTIGSARQIQMSLSLKF